MFVNFDDKSADKIYADGKNKSGADQIRCFLKAIETYPYEGKYYVVLYQAVEKFGGNIEEVEDIATYFGRTDLIENYKKKQRADEHIRKQEDERKKHQSFIANSVQEVNSIREPIDAAIACNNFYAVWEQIALGNIYAEYALERYYTDVVCKSCIDSYNLKQMTKNLSSVQERATNGNLFAQYLIARIHYNMYTRDRRNTAEANIAAKSILNTAVAGNVSAIASKGYFGSNGYNSATSSVHEAIICLERAAQSQHPMALGWLGSYYRTGGCGLAIDKNKAEELLALATAYGHKYGEKEYQQLKNGSTTESSSCYITTAVCNSLGKSDNCYELINFRKFRDNWLRFQPEGESLIAQYYATAPTIVDSIDKQKNHKQIYQSIWDTYLNPCLNYIENQQYEDCKRLYIQMVCSFRWGYFLDERCNRVFLSTHVDKQVMIQGYCIGIDKGGHYLVQDCIFFDNLIDTTILLGHMWWNECKTSFGDNLEFPCTPFVIHGEGIIKSYGNSYGLSQFSITKTSPLGFADKINCKNSDWYQDYYIKKGGIPF